MADEKEVDMEWLQDQSSPVESLRQVACAGKLPEKMRATAWRLFLNVLEAPPDTWADSTKRQREDYVNMRSRALDRLEIAKAARQKNDSEAQEDSSEKGESSFAEEEDQELAELEDAADQIRVDLERCYPEGANSFFLDKKRQELMFHLLLTWTNEYPNPGYRQGIHEVLAPILWTMEQGLGRQEDNLSIDSPLRALGTHQEDLESDCFYLFAAIVDQFIPLYDTTRRQDSLAVTTCRKIQSARLAGVDQELARHLASFGCGKDAVIPQIYMLSWLRLAFGRQLSIQDTIRLWDFFFATEYQLLEWLEACAVLLIVLDRDSLLRATSGITCLQILLRTVAPEPIFFATNAQLIIENPASTGPLIAALQHHANLSHVLPTWFVSILGSFGFVEKPPQYSLTKPAAPVSSRESSLLSVIYPSNLCGRSVPSSVHLLFFFRLDLSVQDNSISSSATASRRRRQRDTNKPDLPPPPPPPPVLSTSGR